MKVLTVFAHPASRSFCHAVLERFDAGLREAGHTNDIVDLYAIGFDPILRDRKRTLRLFGFDYRFEAFVPAPQRRWGYYILPILEGDRLIGRLDPKLRRDEGVLEIRRIWWEPGVRQSKGRLVALEAAVERLARLTGAATFQLASISQHAPGPSA